jgi:four helix bundle protein
MGNFMKLRVWQEAKENAVNIYRITQNNKFLHDWGLKDQIQRSAVSIPSNIAEGDELSSDKQSIRHFYISKGSIAELTTQLIIAWEIGYIDNAIKNSLLDDCNRISAMLTNLIKARSKAPN